MAGLQKHAYWIHQKVESKSSVTGYVYLRQCKCSNCGTEYNMEKEVCPHCGAIMDQTAPKDEDEDK